MKSLPLAVKVGGAGALGGGGIAGTGLLIHDQVQKSKTISTEQVATVSNEESEEIYKLTEVDKALIKDSNSVFGTTNSEKQFVIGNTVGEQNQVSLKITVTTVVEGAKYGGGKWSCTIKGIAETEGNTVYLNGENKFSNKEQSDLFLNQFSSKKEGFVKSCSRNRTNNIEASNENLESTLTLKLKESGNQWIFDEADVAKVFEGNWTNS